MNRHQRRRHGALAAKGFEGAQAPSQPRSLKFKFRGANPKTLLLGTALASTLLLGTVTAPSPAHAVDCFDASVPPAAPGGSGPITVKVSDSIVCVNTDARTDGVVIGLETYNANHDIYLSNSGELVGRFQGISASTGDKTGINSSITIINIADITVAPGPSGQNIGINSITSAANSSIVVTNSGALSVTASNGNGIGIRGLTLESVSPLTIINSGEIDARASIRSAFSIQASTEGSDSEITITNSGALTAISANESAFGIQASTEGSDSEITIRNSGTLDVSSRGYADGIFAISNGANSEISIVNTGNLTVEAGGTFTSMSGANANAGIQANTYGEATPISVTNHGDIDVTTAGRGIGIFAAALGNGVNPVTISNSGDIRTEVTTDVPGDMYNFSGGIVVLSNDPSGPITIENSGSLYSKGGLRNFNVGVFSTQGHDVTITNTGDMSSESDLTIFVQSPASASIYNAGTITGYVQLADLGDKFINQSGGVFETKKTSYFGGGDDLFVNQTGATVLAASNASKRESSGFEGLETFKNSGGTISLVDGGVGDKFTIANTPGGKDLKFEGGGYLAVDAELRGPGSKADNFIVDGDVSGQTKVMVNNTSTLPGTFNSQGIPVVFVEGKTPSANNFVLAGGPIDTGLFDYDLFFVPTGSGFWELRSFAGASAHALPKLLTAAQDIWHETSSTWFDRTADLRVVLNGGGSPAYDAGTKGLAEAGPNGLTPGVWIKGGGSRLDRDGSATTKAYGNTYNYDLDNELSTFDLQMGVDMGQYDVLSQGDVLILGVLGGFVGAGLDYDSLSDSFNFSGGQVGAYATYLKDGLFVDTLLNVHLYDIDTPNFGMPDSLSAATVGLRTDAGYRFGSFTGGAFFEPLATIEVTWADIDGFNVGGNKVSFSDDANVRGRIGGRVGTTTEAWEGSMMEPFLIASLWGNLSDENSATLVSSGRTFQFNDDLQDVWGELSAGVNLFNFTQTTAVFAKVDYTFGEDVKGVGGKAGMRVAW